MGCCDYHNKEKSGPWNGWYCNKMGGYAEQSLYRHYCNDSIRCQYCPIRGGDDRDRKPNIKEPERPAEKPSRRWNDHEETDTGTTGGGNGGGGNGGGGGGGSSLDFFDVIGAVGKTVGFTLIATAIVSVLYFGGDLLGLLGPWVDFKLPNNSPLIQDASLYSVSWETDTQFESRSGDFDKDGLAHARFHRGASDVYYSQDQAAVWIGTCHLLTLNTAVVYDVTEEDIQSQLFQTLLIHLTDSQDVPILSEPAVTLAGGESVEMQYMGDDLWVAVLPSDLHDPSLTLTLNGYKPVTFSVDMKERVMEVNVKMAAEED